MIHNLMICDITKDQQTRLLKHGISTKKKRERLCIMENNINFWKGACTRHYTNQVKVRYSGEDNSKAYFLTHKSDLCCLPLEAKLTLEGWNCHQWNTFFAPTVLQRDFKFVTVIFSQMKKVISLSVEEATWTQRQKRGRKEQEAFPSMEMQ